MKKRLLFMLLGVLIALPTLARNFWYEYEGQPLSYTVIDEDAKTVMVLYGASITGKLIIPEKAKDGNTVYSVTSISAGAFKDCSGLTSVIIPNSVTSI
ncbi:MAG: leucine-rich repeat domain-containing protein, partial [Muribaculaceae bacterium]|nr:leucine-rich repeat domain-containing protein [Muribaculaceae bacterium]